MSKNDFTDIMDGLSCTPTKIIFGLNLNNQRENGTWNSENVEKLLKFIKQKNYKMDFELGNEPNSYRRKFDAEMTPELQINSTRKLIRILKKLGIDSAIYGPDSTGRALSALKYLSEYAETNPPTRALIYHHYSLDSRKATQKDYLSPSSFKLFQDEILLWTSTIQKVSSKELWLGETAIAWGGGQQNYTDRFIGSFLWADKLGQAALHGIKVLVRETIFSGYYGLIGYDFVPNPDYWISLFHKKLMGQKVLKVENLFYDEKVNLYAHCGIFPDTITLMAINFSAKPKKLIFKNPNKMTVYAITAADGLHSKNVLINGKPPKSVSGSFLQNGKVIQGRNVKAPKYSVMFVVMKDLSLKCI